mgnify:CR=1 FL=1
MFQNADYNPLIDITVYLDVSRNSGPNSLVINEFISKMKLKRFGCKFDVYVHPAITAYARSEMFKLCYASNINIPGLVLGSLKNVDPAD